jgi:hypothetical protein
VWSSQVDDSTSCYLYSKEAICKAQKEAYKVPGTQSDITSGVIGQGNWAIREELLFEGICEFDSEPIHLCDEYTLIRDWHAEDDCGNAIDKHVEIKVHDLEPPTQTQR